MDGSSLLEGEGLIAVGLGPEKGSYLVEQATEARRRGAVFEPAHRRYRCLIPRWSCSRWLFK
jgi:hypothetical protein